MLSVCLIARNEEKSLPRALASVRAVADEIILADTGSTDRTEQVAKDHGAVVCHFPWCDDFSAARNFAVSHARGDWILWLDADEELLPDSLEELRQSLTQPGVLAYQVQRQDLRQTDRPDYFTLMWQLRLFRRRDDLRFLGRCHPHFEPEIDLMAQRLGLQVRGSSITLRHYGYIGELRPAKLQRAARLLDLELRDRPGQLYYLIEYGRTLLLLEDRRGHEILREAADLILQQAGAEEPSMPVVALALEYLLSLSPGQLPPGYTPGLVRELAQRWFPSAPPLLWLMARQAAEAGKVAEAERILRSLVQMGREHSYDLGTSFDPRFIGGDAKMNLAVCLVRQSKVEEACALFRELLASPEHAQQARTNLAVLEDFLRQSASGGIRYSLG